jgi:transposase
MTDLEWHALLPFVERRAGPGRPLRELRARMDAIFWVGAHHAKWSDLPEAFGRWGTVARYFRRLSHNGLWQKLLLELARADPTHPLARLEFFICRAARRAYRLLGLRLIVLARRLGLMAALPGPAWMLPDPDLSHRVFGRRFERVYDLTKLAVVRMLKFYHGLCGGRRRIPGAIARAWF